LPLKQPRFTGLFSFELFDRGFGELYAVAEVVGVENRFDVF